MVTRCTRQVKAMTGPGDSRLRVKGVINIDRRIDIASQNGLEWQMDILLSKKRSHTFVISAF
jgi:hypothetical protein